MEGHKEIYETLAQRRDEIARAWHQAVIQASPLPLDTHEVYQQFVEDTERLLKALVADPFNPVPIQEIGRSLDFMDNFQPKSVLRVFEVLATQLTSQLSPEQCTALQLRLIRAFNALATGFFIGKAERAKRFDMEAMSRMGHDLKTPINAITGFSRVILKGIDGPITEFQQEDLTSIYEAGQKLLTMINDIFETAKSDARKTRIYGPTFDVAELLGDVMATAQPMLAKHDHTLEVRGYGSLGTMHADASRVRWMLLSLLLYASRLAEHRTISLSAMRERVANADRFAFEISEVLPAEAVEQLRTSMALGEDDTFSVEAEIGLTVCSRFCAEMGGTLEMGLEPGNLAKFTLYLPAYVPGAD